MKKLEINCGFCDATRLTEDALAGYGAVEVNCGTLAVTDAAQRLFLNRGADLNTGTVLKIPDGADLALRMGSFTVAPREKPSRPTAMVVMGSLTVKPDAGETLSGYICFRVMGRLLCPRSLYDPALFQVMGSQTLIPDGYEYAEGPLTLGRNAPALYGGRRIFTEDPVIFTEDADPDSLAASGAVFSCPGAAVPEKLLDSAHQILELPRPDALTPLPEGALYLSGNQNLTKRLLRLSKRLYIDGGLTVERRNGDLLRQLEYLRVTGRALVPEELEDALLDLDPLCGDVFPYRGALIRDREVTVTRARLRKEGFLTLLDCAHVELAEDLTPEEIEDGLSLTSCDEVVCTPAQEDAVRDVSEHPDRITVRTPGEEEPGSDGEPRDPDTVEINCGTYRF